MRVVVGKRTRDVGEAEFETLRGARPLVLDLGTGDGKHVLAVARTRPEALVVGLDAQPDALRRTSRTAAAKPAKGGTPNAMFVWSSVESLPAALRDVDEVHCLMPWGSLLRAFVRPDVDVLRAVARTCCVGARFLVTLNLHAWRPAVPEVGDTPEPTPESALEFLAPAYAAAGWTVTSAEYLDAAHQMLLGTTWTKRLGSSRDDLAVLALRGVVAPR